MISYYLIKKKVIRFNTLLSFYNTQPPLNLPLQWRHYRQALQLGSKETNLPNICIFPTDIHFSLPDCTTLMDVRTENTDVREVGFHPPLQLCHRLL